MQVDNQNQIIAAPQKQYKLVEGYFINDSSNDVYIKNMSRTKIGIKGYIYRCPLDIASDLKEGDLVVVENKDGRLEFLKISFVDVNPLELEISESKLSAWILSKVDIQASIQRKHDAAMRDSLIKALKVKKAAAEEAFIYNKLAETDTEVADMLNKLNELGGF